ncbi:hypothetical protein POJ06DRAFT_242062 [Lipomyces tetrasporus]|uniref:CENP-V/GFA domain-containing protein n=1 Tax=Lipomyces tetrasporus TaxID=54092 RepID=A0AAD7QXZ7_9ASCO|nr:uncharacterized protein POJ06DRAFT_242062 [Lipomyces tetrasporus]KAJ8103500.1 hypothetical protein POJ06DRAFT_242062 [Lipomyces tetrasporus]
MSSPASSSTQTRRPYHGSCHCGRTRYIVFISLPPATIGSDQDPQNTVRFYKCNCSTCHKMGIFHVRVADSPHDFYLLSPLDLAELSDYTCFNKKIHWLFCPTCGVRCFAVMGKGKVVDIDLEAALGNESDGKTTQVWGVEEEGWKEDKTGYLSVNALTIEPGQEGLDLRELAQKKWIQYLDVRDGKEEDRYDYPHEGGTW